MNKSYISDRDRILVAAVEIISEAGLSSLTLDNLSVRSNLSEALIYKYFGGVNEILVEVVANFVKFDKSIMKTVAAKQMSTINKVKDFFEAYVTYYDSYREITSVILNYEDLLHNTGTREMISTCIIERTEFLKDILEKGIEKNEITDVYEAEELANILIGIMNGIILNRRVMYHEESLKTEVMAAIDKTMNLIRVN